MILKEKVCVPCSSDGKDRTSKIFHLAMDSADKNGFLHFFGVVVHGIQDRCKGIQPIRINCKTMLGS